MDPVLEADGEQRWRHRGSCEGAKVVSGYYVCPVLYQWGIYSVATGARMALYSTREAAQADLQRYAPQKENGAE